MVKYIAVLFVLFLAVSVAVGEQENTTPKTRIKTIDRFPVPAVSRSTMSLQSQTVTGPLFPLEDTFKLHSRPVATKTIYLDFDGHNGFEGDYTPFNFEGDDSSFSDNELIRIQQIWQSVVEDFLPFDVDVTTEFPGVEALRKRGVDDTEWGTRAVIDGSNTWDYSWAYVGDFDYEEDYECYIYPGDNSWIWIADSISHEVGHTLGLEHDGVIDGDEYYAGHGSGDTHWAPIMGWTKTTLPYGLGQWGRGFYTNANNDEDDLAIITTQNGFGYRTDDHGSVKEQATVYDIVTGFAEGIIEKNTDVDYFKFTMPFAGNIEFVINPASYAPNLDILAKLHDASGAVIYTSNPPTALDGGFNVFLGVGDYYISIDGTGYDDPYSDGYPDYGSLGYYSIESVSDPAGPGVDAGVDMLTWSGKGVGLAPTVVNNSDPVTALTYQWTAVPDDGVVFSPSDTAENPTVTITKATANPSVVTLTLAVNNVGRTGDDVTDSMTISVFDTACKMTRLGAGEDTDNAADLDGDCFTGLSDLAIMAQAWLVDTALKTPVPAGGG